MREKQYNLIDKEYIERIRKKTKIGDVFRVFDPRRIKDDRTVEKNTLLIVGRVTGKYRHLVTLDCGASITYAQIAQMKMNGWKYIK